MLYLRVVNREFTDIAEYPAWRLGGILGYLWAFRDEWRQWLFRLVWY
jgi:hypothetical protein